MRRFRLGVLSYIVLCLVLAAFIIVRGDGPHPRIVEMIPHNGDLYFPGGPVEITFSQPMDTASVERAVEVSPSTQGQGAWYGNTLNIQPLSDWLPNITYHVAIKGKVTDDEGRPLRTPVSLWFHVHHITRVGLCSIGGTTNVCDTSPGYHRPLTHGRDPVVDVALSSDGTYVAFTRRDASGITHLFIVDVTNGRTRQLTYGNSFADSKPSWLKDENSSVTYIRRPISARQGHRNLGGRQIWNIGIDGTQNARLG